MKIVSFVYCANCIGILFCLAVAAAAAAFFSTKQYLNKTKFVVCATSVLEYARATCSFIVT